MRISNLLLLVAVGIVPAVYGQFTENRELLLYEKSHHIPRVVHDELMDRDPGDLLLADDFSDFTNWTVYTESGTSYDWEWGTSTPTDMVDFMAAMASPSNANGFAYFNGISHLLEGTVMPVDALVEYNSSVDCSGLIGVNVSFFIGYRAYNYDQIFVEVTNNDWVDFESYELYSTLATNGDVIMENVRVNISAAAADESDVKIRFRFKELGGDIDLGCGYGIMIDDFELTEAWEYDQAITAAYHRSGLGVSNENGLEYHFISINQATDIHFASTTLNEGSVIQDGAKINAEVTGADAYSGSSTPIDLAIGAADSLSCSIPFVPSALGDLNVTYWVDSDNTEEYTANDTIISEPITITGAADNFLYGRDNNIPQGSIANVASNSGQPFLIGNTMDFFADDTIGAVDVFITGDITNVGELLYGQVMLFDPDAGDFIYLNQTPDHLIEATEIGGPITLYFEEPVAIEAGQPSCY